MTDEEMAERLRSKGWGCESPATYRIDFDESFRKLWAKVQDYTLISMERAWGVYSGIRYLLQRNIEGDLVECGVWKGGTCMLMAHTLLAAGARPRQLWLYDTFKGMPSPGKEDRIASTGEALSKRCPEGWWAAGEELVRSNLAKTGYPSELLEFVPGDVCQTLREKRPKKIALLRLDTDWYASTKAELEFLYPSLVSGGFLIIDDFGHFQGVQQAVEEFFTDPGTAPYFHRSDYTGRIGIKESPSKQERWRKRNRRVRKSLLGRTGSSK